MGSPATLLTTMTAAAPAFCALRILDENVQLPRLTRAILPVSDPAGSALHARLSDVPERTAWSSAVKFDETTAKAPVAAPTVLPPAVTGAPTKWFTVLAPAVRARAADP